MLDYRSVNQQISYKNLYKSTISLWILILHLKKKVGYLFSLKGHVWTQKNCSNQKFAIPNADG